MASSARDSPIKSDLNHDFTNRNHELVRMFNASNDELISSSASGLSSSQSAAYPSNRGQIMIPRSFRVMGNKGGDDDV